MKTNHIDVYIGYKTGFLTVTEPTERFYKHPQRDGQNECYRYWKCICGRCGGTTEVMALNLWKIKGKNTQSCGCLNKEFYAPLKKIEGLSAHKSVYAKHKVYCRHRKIESNLSFDEFWNISNLNCEYCGCPPDKELPATDKNGKKTRNGGCKFSGLDRIDNSKQYLLSNVLSCCKFCNLAKHSNPIELFLSKVKSIYENLELGQKEISEVILSLHKKIQDRQEQADKVNPEDRIIISDKRGPYYSRYNEQKKLKGSL